MDIDEVATQILQWLNRHRKLITLLIAVPTLALLLAYIFINYAVVNVTVASSGNYDNITIVTSSNSANKEIGKPGFHLVPRNIKGVIAQSNKNVRTQTQVDIPWYGYLSKEIVLKPDKNAEKIAYKSMLAQPCGAYSAALDRMFQYACSKPNVLVHYNTPLKGNWTIETTALLPYGNSIPVPYMGGLIGVRDLRGDAPISAFIIAVSDKGLRTSYKQPQFIDSQTITKVKIFTDQHDQTNNRFVLVEPNGTIHLGTPKSDGNVDYIKVDPPKDYIPDVQQTLCHLQGSAVSCYRGLSPYPSDATRMSRVKPSIISLDFAGITQRTEKPLTANVVLQTFAVTKSGQYYGKNYKTLLHFKEEGSVYTAQAIAQNVDAIVASDTLYVLQDKGIFTIDPKTNDLYQVFYSSNITPKQIMAAANKIFIIGKVAKDTDSTYAWRLTDENDTNYGNRLIDKLPAFPDRTTYGTVDLVGNKIDITIDTTRFTTRQDIAQKKQQTLNYLKDQGIDTNSIVVVN